MDRQKPWKVQSRLVWWKIPVFLIRRGNSQAWDLCCVSYNNAYRWTILFLWQYSNAANICLKMTAASFSVKWPAEVIRSKSSPPVQILKQVTTRYLTQEQDTYSYHLQTIHRASRCSDDPILRRVLFTTVLSMSTSDLNRARSRILDLGIILTARSCLVSLWITFLTTPKLPLPSCYTFMLEMRLPSYPIRTGRQCYPVWW